MQLHFKESGQGRAVVLLHGLFGSLDNWHPVAVRLAEQFHVFAVDQRNHGQSPHSAEMSYALMAEDVNELLVARGLESVSLAGHSMGGKVAMQFALQFPGKVEKLLVEDMAPRAYLPSHNKIFTALLALDLPAFKARQEIEEALAPGIPSLMLRRFLLKNLAHEPQDARAFKWRIPLPAIFANYPKLCAPLASQPPFPGPVLFLHGGQSPYVSEADAPRIRELFSQAVIEAIPQARHWIHADAPDDFVRHVSAFLNR